MLTFTTLKPILEKGILFACLLPCMFLNLAFSEPAAAANAFDPQRTYAVIAGVLQWPAKNDVPGFDTQNRKDQELYDTLAQRGVPREQMILLLDSDATLEGTRKALNSVLERTTPDSTFIFYYAGHGGSDVFINYDTQNGLLHHSEITKAVKRYFKGQNVLLLADCCQSGGIGVAAKELAGAGFKAASLASADVLTVSTGNWTFTQAILDALNGSVLCDFNNDGVITLRETIADVASEMNYRERQACGYVLAGLPDFWQLARTKGVPMTAGPAPGRFKFREYVRTPHENGPRHGHIVGLLGGQYLELIDSQEMPNGKEPGVGRIVGWINGQYLVEFYGYSEKKLLPFEPAQLSAIEFKTYEPGAIVVVSWRKEPVAAKVVRRQHGLHQISYLGWPDYWDDWVLGDRILGSPAQHPVRQDIVLVERQGRWSPAEIIKTDPQQHRFFIHYIGEEAAEDQWVPETRLKRVNSAP